jgi:hypothetical protein
MAATCSFEALPLEAIAAKIRGFIENLVVYQFDLFEEKMATKTQSLKASLRIGWYFLAPLLRSGNSFETETLPKIFQKAQFWLF